MIKKINIDLYFHRELKHLLFYCLMFSISSNTFSQDPLFTFNVGANGGRTNLTQFKEYADNYNSTLADYIDKDLGYMRWSAGWSFGLGAHIGGLFLEFENERKYASTYSTQTNPAIGTRYFEMLNHTKSISIGFNLIEDQESEAFITAGFLFGIDNITVTTYRKYPSGDFSLGDENNTSGKYTGNNLTIGLRGDFNMKLMNHLYFCGGLRMFSSAFGFMAKDIRSVQEDKNLVPSWTRGSSLHLGLRYSLNKK